MDSVDDKGMGSVTDGSWREKRKRGRPRKYGLNAPIIHSVSPLPIADSSPAGFPSNFLVFPVKNRTLVPTGSVSAGGSRSKALHGAVSEYLGNSMDISWHFLFSHFTTFRKFFKIFLKFYGAGSIFSLKFFKKMSCRIVKSIQLNPGKHIFLYKIIIFWWHLINECIENDNLRSMFFSGGLWCTAIIVRESFHE